MLNVKGIYWSDRVMEYWSNAVMDLKHMAYQTGASFRKCWKNQDYHEVAALLKIKD
jgi:hypothetical protein